MQGIPVSQNVPCSMHINIMGIACIPAIPVILKSPHSDFHCSICREFDFTGILWGFPALDVHFATRGFPALSMGKTFAVYLRFKPAINLWKKCVDLRPFSRCLVVSFLGPLRMFEVDFLS